MDDLDDVRAALGYRTINVYGVSYGALAALQYLRQHPDRVRALALAGVGTPDQKQPLQFAQGAQAALDRLVGDCAATPECRQAFPDLAADLRAVLDRFAAGPVSFDLPAAGGAEAARVRLSRTVFAEHLRLRLYNVRSASRVPLVVRQAARDDWAPFARATSLALRGVSPALALGMYFSVTCSETVAVISEADIVDGSRGSFVGEDRTRVHVEACREWPRGAVPAEFYRPVVSQAPVLMLSGEVDPATPARFATAAARTLPNSRQVLVPNGAHEYFADCLRDLVAEFIDRGSARDLDTRCVAELRRPPFVTR
jgi:pimeloyl-ACP methyl ester carboxylesterase